MEAVNVRPTGLGKAKYMKDQVSRRTFIKSGTIAGVGLSLPLYFSGKTARAQMAAAVTQTPLPGSAIPQFVDPLPNLDVILAGTAQIELRMTEFQSSVLSTGTLAPGVAPATWVWGYLQPGQTTRASYLGPVIVATKGVPAEFKFVNNLGSAATSRLLAYVNSTDQTLDWADPLNTGPNPNHYLGPIPAAVHLHGGEVPPVLDGGPDSWFTSDGVYKGHGFYSKAVLAAGKGKKLVPVPPTNYSIYRYPNSQEAGPIWFHDHTLGATRLNVYAGLAGGYLVVDPNPYVPNLPPLAPLVIQDRSFDTNGQLFFPAGVPFIPNPDHPFWVPEFVGDVICVNGKSWPYANVEPKRYRFIIINGSNARAYEMFLTNPVTGVTGPTIWQIGTDGGFLDRPVAIDPNAVAGLRSLVLMPGERADVIIDFSNQAPGTTLVLRNTAKTPFPNGAAALGGTTGRIMQFRVVPLTAADNSYDPVSNAPLRAPMVRLADALTGTVAAGATVQQRRQMTLNEVLGPPVTVNGIAYPGGPLEVLVNNTRYSGASTRPAGDFTPVTNADGTVTFYSELPKEGDTELWEIINLTADAHPIHLHLAQFQLMNRQTVDVPKYNAAYAASFPGGLYIPGYGPPLNYLTGNPLALGGNPDVTPFLKSVPALPAPNEAGWKDTVTMYPGQVTRIVVRWAPTSLPANTPPSQAAYPFDPNGGHGYVWHCHIVDHEDNEMMRPNSIIPLPVARTYVKGIDY